MIDEIRYPETLSAEELDDYLAKGWYRMGQGIFTARDLYFDEEMHQVFWLRYNIQKIVKRKTLDGLLALNRHFSVTIVKPLGITDELEDLYARYASHIPFSIPHSLHSFIYDNSDSSIFDSHLIEVRDQNKLIAAGIYDNGKNSIAGIINFYDPRYKRYSLGRYLMLVKALYARKQGITWYYPGYILYGNPTFDYKLYLDKNVTEFCFKLLDIWIPYNSGYMKELGERTVDYEKLLNYLQSERLVE